LRSVEGGVVSLLLVQVKLRSKLNKLVFKASDVEGIEAALSSRPVTLAKSRMQRRMLAKIRRRAYGLGLAEEFEERVKAAAVVEEPLVIEPELAAAPAPVAAAPAPVVAAAAVASPDLSIAEQVEAEVKTAMKAKDKIATSTLRNIKAALLAGAKDAGVDRLDDAAAVKVLRKLAKMRQESIDMYLAAGETGADRAAGEQAELDVIERWLPKLADEATVKGWVQAILDATDGPPNKGKIMGALMKDHKDELDGKMAGKVADDMIKAAAA